MRREFERALLRELGKLKQEKLEQLGAGGLDIEQYRYWTGYIKAFDSFVEVIKDLKKRENDDGDV